MASAGPLVARGSVPGHDLVAPAAKGAAQGADLGREGGVLQVGDRSGVAADLFAHPPPRPGRQPMPRRRELGVLESPRPDPATKSGAPPPGADHPQDDGLIERGEIDQVDLAMVLHPRCRSAPPARRPVLAGGDGRYQPSARERIDRLFARRDGFPAGGTFGVELGGRPGAL